MKDEADKLLKVKRSLWILSMVNVGIWTIAIIGMIFVMQHSPGAKRLSPILLSGSGVGIAMISAIGKIR